MKWEKIVRFTFRIVCEEGLQIRGSGGGLEIGGIEPNLMVIRSPVTDEPYIPGSSLKGKLRSVLEKAEGKVKDGGPCTCGQRDCLICTLFGAHMNPGAHSSPTRIVVRDARLAEASRATFQQSLKAGKPFFEEKTENIVDRKSGTAKHPRTGERVPPGTVFDGEILLHVYQGDDPAKMESFVRRGLGLIEKASSLGASGSRGYGKVRFENFKSEVTDVSQVTL